ncbi:SDR family NAD(P)-dependent oxidoreductase [Sphingomonas sp. OTU376]|uniref:SDR family NAD(P)-dependent oxidoreductase n=1 Tax=Sphingomonas sp. OTU376 TaxID=3043863 RepID=UPI00313CB439
MILQAPCVRPRSGIVNVISSVTLAAFPLAVAYATSKQAIESFTGSLAHELAYFDIAVKLVEPGYALTANFGANATGECARIDHIERKLNAEGYTNVASHLDGPTICRQLRQAVSKARGESARQHGRPPASELMTSDVPASDRQPRPDGAPADMTGGRQADLALTHSGARADGLAWGLDPRKRGI